MSEAADPLAEIESLADEEVVAALAAAGEARDTFLANVLATEATNRMQRATLIAENLGEGLCVLDARGRVRSLNETAERILGVAADDLVGLHLHDAIHCAEAPSTTGTVPICPVTEALSSGLTIRMEQAEAIAPDGAPIPLALSASPIEREGATAGVLLLFRSVHERVAADEFRAARHAARDAAHDILSTARTPQEAAAAVMRALGENLGWDLGAFWLLEEATGTLRCVGAWKGPRVAAEAFERATLALTFPPGTGFPGTVLRTRAPAWLPDVTRDPGFQRAEEAIAAGLRTGLAVPILHNGAVVGVLELFHRESLPTDSDLLDTLEGLARQIGLFMARVEDHRRLRQTLALLEGTLDATSEGILVVTLTGGITLANARFLEIWGLPSEALEGSDEEAIRLVASRLVDPGVFTARIQEIYANPSAESFDVLEFNDGRIIERTGRPHRVADRIVGRVWTFHDATQRRRAEEALRRREEQLAEAERLAHLGSWEWEIPEDRVTWSDELCRIFGVSPCDRALTYERYLSRVHPEDRAFVEEAVQRAIESRSAFTFRHRIITPAGGERVLHCLGEVFTDADGRPRRLVGTALDITERSRQEEALRESEARYRRIVETAHEGIWIINGEGRTTYANARLAEMLGYRVEEMLGRTMYEFMDPDLRPIAARNMERRRRGITEIHDFRFQRSDGSDLWTLISANPITNAQGEFEGALGMITDITDRKRAEDALAALNADLEKRIAVRTRELAAANAELESFSYTVSHDLQAPLRGIEAYSNALLEDLQGKLPQVDLEHLTRVREEAQRMSQLIADILALSRTTRGRLQETHVDLSATARSILDGLARQDPGRRVEASVEPGLVATGDPRLLRVVLENLLGNAWKFTSLNPHARIEFGSERASDGSLSFYVRDNGVGFDPQDTPRLFEPFERLQAEKRGFEGTGIGLATVKRIIERHGGGVSAEGRPGEGATFRFTL